MRILHTSDWHLGRSLHGADLRAAQAGFVDALVATVRAERVELVVVAGDVFDRAIPPVDAVDLYDEALWRLHDAGARVVVSSGNHDSAARLGAGSRLADAAGVHVRTRPSGLAHPVLLDDAHGPVGVYALPYLEPDAVRSALPGLGEARGHAGVLAHAAGLVAADAAARGLRRTLVVAHAWVSGGRPSQSERDIAVGGVGQVPAALFAPFCYTALGHLHGPQAVTPAVRYSGSPLPYSFSEARQRKGWWLVELGPNGLAGAEFVPAPVHRRLAVVRGPLDELLGSAEFTADEDAFVAATLTDPSRPVDAMDRLRRRFAHVLTLAWEPSGRAPDEASYSSRLRGRDDLDVAAGFVAHVRGSPAAAAERAQLSVAFEAVRIAADDTADLFVPVP